MKCIRGSLLAIVLSVVMLALVTVPPSLAANAEGVFGPFPPGSIKHMSGVVDFRGELKPCAVDVMATPDLILVSSQCQMNSSVPLIESLLKSASDNGGVIFKTLESGGDFLAYGEEPDKGIFMRVQGSDDIDVQKSAVVFVRKEGRPYDVPVPLPIEGARFLGLEPSEDAGALEFF